MVGWPSDGLLSRYSVTLSASGEATVEVLARDADHAAEIALRETPGMIVEGGECSWDVEDVEAIQ